MKAVNCERRPCQRIGTQPPSQSAAPGRGDASARRIRMWAEVMTAPRALPGQPCGGFYPSRICGGIRGARRQLLDCKTQVRERWIVGTRRNFAMLQPAEYPLWNHDDKIGGENGLRGDQAGASCTRLDGYFFEKSLNRLAGRAARRRPLGFPSVHGGLVHAEPSRERGLRFLQAVAGGFDHFRGDWHPGTMHAA